MPGRVHHREHRITALLLGLAVRVGRDAPSRIPPRQRGAGAARGRRLPRGTAFALALTFTLAPT
ncbi:hypothetical protein J0695_04130, partial [Streptomyces beijiangensis]|nr:hypothetical protein [Streptomyces beijiangensis]